MVTHVQCILYASLAASLFASFLAMLGKQWLNRYASVNRRGSAIERGRDRQRKLDGIVAWYFNHVIGSFRLMLQIALLLLGCALSRYLWEIDTVVASVVLGVTSFGVLFYIIIVVAGVVSESCPYRTPGSSIIRYTRDLLRSARILFARYSFLHSMSLEYWSDITKDTVAKTLAYPLALFIAFTLDAFRLGKATFRALIALVRRARDRPSGTSPVPDRPFDTQATKLDLRCILWMLRTSLDKSINLSTLDFLKTVLSLPDIDSSINSALVVECFNVFSSCFVISDSVVVMVSRGSEHLAEVSARCFLLISSRLSSAEPTSRALKGVRQRYNKLFPAAVDFSDIPWYFIMSAVHCLFAQTQGQRFPSWRDYNPSTDELIQFSRALAQIARFEYRRRDRPKVPRWLLRFALRFLSQDPLPPTSVVLDCLKIIATDLGCGVSDTDSLASGEKCVYPSTLTISPLTLHQHGA